MGMKEGGVKMNKVPWKPIVSGLPYCCSVQVMAAPIGTGDYDPKTGKSPRLPVSDEEMAQGLSQAYWAGANCVIFCASTNQMKEAGGSHELYLKHGFKLIHKCKSNHYGGGTLYFYARNNGEPEDPLNLPVEETKPDKVGIVAKKTKKKV